MDRISRRATLGALGVAALLGTGCMTKPMQPANADGTYCFATGKWHSRKLTCTPTPIPPEAVEAEAKRLEPTPDLLTIYVVRKSWGDTVNQVQLAVDDGGPVATTPESFVRLRVRPGSHQLTATWHEGKASQSITGAAGEVRLVELVGTVWTWSSTYRLDIADATGLRNRLTPLRMVADVR